MKSVVRKLRKFGNSWALTIPKQFLKKLGIDANTPLEVFVRGGQIVVRKLDKASLKNE